jgi:hypothetical protein
MTPLRWALEYAALGWRVMPCHWMIDGACSCGRECGSPGKHPRPRKGSHDATLDGRQIDGWWRSIWPAANIGVATGQASGLYVIDLDGPQAIDEWDGLELAHGEAPTLTARTGGGGQHRYYKLPPRFRLGNTAKRIAPHIDSRGEGGYVLAPPSNHRSGQAYEWENWPTPPADFPAWLARLTHDASKQQKQPRAPAPIARATNDDALGIRIIQEEAEKVALTKPGGRNDQLFKSATSVFELVAGGDIRMDPAWAAMHEAGLIAGLTEREITATLNSAVGAAADSPRHIRTRQEGAAT